MIMINSSFIQLGMRFHNHSFIFFLSILMFFLFIKLKNHSHFYKILFSLLLFTLAIKINFLPIAIFWVVFLFLQKKPLRSSKDKVKDLLIGGYFFFIGISFKNILIYPIFDTFPKYLETVKALSFLKLTNKLSITLGFESLNLFFSELLNNFFNTHLFIGFLLLGLLIYFSYKKLYVKNKINILPSLYLGSYIFVFLYLYLCYMSTRDAAMYGSSNIGIFVLALFLLTNHFSTKENNRLKIILLFLIPYQFICLLFYNTTFFNSQTQDVLFKYTNNERKTNDLNYAQIHAKARDYYFQHEDRYERVYFTSKLEQFYGLFHKKHFKEQIIDTYDILSVEAHCCFFVFTREQMPSTELFNILYHDQYGGYGENKFCDGR